MPCVSQGQLHCEDICIIEGRHPYAGARRRAGVRRASSIQCPARRRWGWGVLSRGCYHYWCITARDANTPVPSYFLSLLAGLLASMLPFLFLKDLLTLPRVFGLSTMCVAAQVTTRCLHVSHVRLPKHAPLCISSQACRSTPRTAADGQKREKGGGTGRKARVPTRCCVRRRLVILLFCAPEPRGERLCREKDAQDAVGRGRESLARPHSSRASWPSFYCCPGALHFLTHARM